MTKLQQIVDKFHQTPDNLIMVDKAILITILDCLPPLVINRIFGRLDLFPPAIEDDHFPRWAFMCRKKLHISQTEVYKATGIGQEDISKFENEKKQFGRERKEKLRDFFLKKLFEEIELAA